MNKVIFASFFDGFPVVERALAQYTYYMLGSLCIEIDDVGIPVCIPRVPQQCVY